MVFDQLSVDAREDFWLDFQWIDLAFFWSLFNIETFHHFTYTFSFIEEYSTVFFFDFLMTHNGILIQSLDADDSSFFHTLFTNRVFMCVTLCDASWCWKAKKRNILKKWLTWIFGVVMMHHRNGKNLYWEMITTPIMKRMERTQV